MKMRKLVYFVLVFSVLLLLVSLFGLYLDNRTIATERFYTSVNITDKLAFDLNNSALTFGYLIGGGVVERNVIFSNEHDFPVVAEIEAEGDIAKWLKFSTPVVIEAEEESKISFILDTPRDAQEGFYDGVVTFTIKPA